MLLSRAALTMAIATPELVTLDQLADVVGGLRRVALVVDLEVLQFAAGELAALFLHIELETLLDHVAERREGAGGRQHQADLDGGLLGLGRAGSAAQQRRGKRKGCLLHGGGTPQGRFDAWSMPAPSPHLQPGLRERRTCAHEAAHHPSAADARGAEVRR
jgi:hypothetical protein